MKVTILGNKGYYLAVQMGSLEELDTLEPKLNDSEDIYFVFTLELEEEIKKTARTSLDCALDPDQKEMYIKEALKYLKKLASQE